MCFRHCGAVGLNDVTILQSALQIQNEHKSRNKCEQIKRLSRFPETKYKQKHDGTRVSHVCFCLLRSCGRSQCQSNILCVQHKTIVLLLCALPTYLLST